MLRKTAGAALILALLACRHQPYAQPPHYVDVTVDPFPGMDGPNQQLTPQELRGRILWNLWSGDNAGFWNRIAQTGFGTSDLLKVIDSRRRATRFAAIGILNQPGFTSASKPDELGLFLDVPKPGDGDGAIDSHIDAATYGRSSGVVGLRLFPNPDFDDAARAAWKKHVAADGINHDYYENPHYYNDPKLVRPYVVGMACAFCHVGPDPVRPPADPENPKWENLNDFIGAQYFRASEVFGNGMGPDSFVWQLLHSWKPGTIDTSFIATDYLNNPGTMNALFDIPQRLTRAEPEHITGGALALLGVKDNMRVPRVLKEGADSAGFNAALSRVFVNIGEGWQYWTRNFNPLIGGKPQSPISVALLQKSSPAWNWSEGRAPDLAAYFVKVAKPLRLADAPGGDRYLSKDAKLLDRGKVVFAENCAGCHSSRQPPASSDQAFFTDNFFGDERRKPVDIVGTNAVRAAATNAVRGHIWDNFSSETYKTLPAVKPIHVVDPLDPTIERDFQIPGGGPGYYRPPSLVGIWATAPFFHNNALGDFTGDPSVDGRMRAFNDAIEKLLWPSKRLGTASILRTTEKSYIQVPSPYLPSWLRANNDGFVRIGPIPRKTPIDLLANLDLDSNRLDLGKLAIDVATTLIDIDKQHLDDDAATARLKQLVPQLLSVNKCPDFVEDKGHLFGTKLPDSDKRALIELLKTF
jgi:mono/diheme cytochrome c family protein